MIKSNKGSFILIGGGLCLLVLSAILPGVMGGRATWTNEMAARLLQASQNYHAVLHETAHAGDESDSEQSFQAVQVEYLEQQSLLAAAKNRGRSSARLLRWLGIAVAGAGIGVHIVRQFKD